MLKVQNYKYLSRGSIKVYGNSCLIRENAFDISDDDKNQINLGHLLRKKSRPPLRREGDIKGFSKNSRHRMQKKMNRVDFKNDQIAYFLTLTYPNPYPTDGKVYKADLDLFIKRLKRSFGELSYMWKLEVQFNRGAPHYHLIVFFKKEFNITYVQKWTSKNWFEVVQRNWEEKNLDHLKAGTNCKIVKTLRQLTNYVTKYLTKKEEDDKLTNQGRYWGCSRNWDDLILEHLDITGKELILFRRVLRKYLKRKNLRMSRKLVSCPNIEIWAHWKFILDALEWSIINAKN